MEDSTKRLFSPWDILLALQQGWVDHSDCRSTTDNCGQSDELPGSKILTRNTFIGNICETQNRLKTSRTYI